jgi:hypothetical protein
MVCLHLDTAVVTRDRSYGAYTLAVSAEPAAIACQVARAAAGAAALQVEAAAVTGYQWVGARGLQYRHEVEFARGHGVGVHAVVTASCDPELRAMINSFDVVGPDGQPVRWALNLLHGTRLRDRLYGPEMMTRLCRRAAEEGLPIFLYGGTPLWIGHDIPY